MEFLKSLWPNSSTNVITIPQHIEGELEDDLDLKVRSLAYLFRRLDIENLPAFINDENGIYDLKRGEGATDAINGTVDANNDYNEKLDTIYNKSEFERVLIADEHRILVDWFKNRFRSICILSNKPTSELIDLGKHFRFIVLKPESSDEEYLKTLINSDIYMEHSIETSVKADIIMEIIQKQKSLKPSYKKNFNKNDRSNIILQYVQKLSEVVQIDRIYKASLLSKLEQYRINTLGLIKEDETIIEANDSMEFENGVKVFPTNTINPRSRSRSPVRKRRDSDDNTSRPSLHKPLSTLKLNAQLPPPSLSASSKLTPPSSPSRASLHSSQSPKIRSRSSSPKKSLKKKQSMTLLKMDKSLSSTLSTPSITPPSSTSTDEILLTNDEKTLIYSQSETAVLFRVDRERKLLRSN